MIVDKYDAEYAVELLGGRISQRQGHLVVDDLDERGEEFYDAFLADIVQTEPELEPWLDIDEDEARWRVSHICRDLDMESQVVNDEDGKPFLIVASYADLSAINDEYNRRYNYHNWRGWRKVYLNAPGVEDFRELRLCRWAGQYVGVWHPQAKAPFLVPDEVLDLPIEFGFADEWAACDDCRGLIRTAPDSYSWQPEFFDLGDGQRTCKYCIQAYYVEEYIQAHTNQPRMLNDCIVDPSEHGWTRLDDMFENGLHPGQNDDPAAIIHALNAQGIDCLFTGLTGQFDVNFWVWAHDDDEERAIDVLTRADKKLPYDPGTEMAKALRGERSDYIQVVRKRLMPDGTWQEDEDDN